MNIKKVFLVLIPLVGMLCIGVIAGFFFAQKQQSDEVSLKVFAYNLAAKQHLEQGELDEATLAAIGAITLEPTGYASFLTLGDIYVKQGNVNSARWAYRRARSKIDEGGKSQFFDLSNKQIEFEKCMIDLKIENSQEDHHSVAKRCADKLSQGNSDQR